MSVNTLSDLILGRPGEDLDALAYADGDDVAAAAAALLTSRDFLVETLEPLLDGTLRPSAEPAPESLQRWAERVLGLAPRAPEPRLMLLARALEGPVLAPVVRGLDIAWSPGAFGAAAAAAFGIARPSAPLSNTLAALRPLARGLELDDVFGLSVGTRPREFRLEGLRPSILFRLGDSEDAPDAVCRLDFGLQAEGPDPQSTLWVLYEGDAAFDVPLRARGRPAVSAYLAAPSRIRSLRWEIDAEGRSVVLTHLAARRVEPSQLEGQILTVAGPRGLDWLAAKRLPNVQPARCRPDVVRLSKTLTRRLGGHDVRRAYADWLADNELAGTVAEPVWRRTLASLRRRPGIDLFLTIEAGTDVASLRQTFESLTRQIYPHWAVLLAPVRPLDALLRAEIGAWTRRDTRFVAATSEQGSRRASLDSALEAATGEWFAALSPGELLRPDALLTVAARLEAKPETRLLYTDHDELDADGTRTRPVFKPDMSPEMLLGRDYIERLALLRASDVRAVGGWGDACEHVGENGLILRILERLGPAATDAVEHVAEVLLHRPTPVAPSPRAREVAVGLVRAHLARRGIPAEVEPAFVGGQHVRPRPPTPVPLLSLVMPTRDRADLLAMSVGSILERTAGTPFELLILDNDSREPATHALLRDLGADPRVRVVPCPGEFNYSLINNLGVAQCRGEVVGLINNDIEVTSATWAEELLAWAMLPEIGCVGAKLFYPDGRLQHGGVIIGINGVAAHSHKYSRRTDAGYGLRLALVHNVSAVTGACLFVRKALYEFVGGLDEQMRVAFNDVDFCLKVHQAGFRNLMVPSVELLHHESASRGDDIAPEKAARFLREIQMMKDRWRERLHADPFYSPNLTYIHENFGLNWDTARGDRLWAHTDGHAVR